MDIVTHLAICASQDWGRVDRIAVGNFVTASQAQRKWYTKIIGKISSGDYRLGAVSANSGSLVLCISDRRCVEFCQHHCAESDDWAARGGEDASLRTAWDTSALQSEYHALPSPLMM